MSPTTAQAHAAGAMNCAEKRPAGAPRPRPEHEFAALLWVIAALLACLDALWWLGGQIYS
jgi:hypothetical protein